MNIRNLSDAVEPFDVSGWKINPVPIAGRYPKIELLNADKRYIIKFADYRQNGNEVPYHVSEYIACRLIMSLGYAVQSVAMVTYHGNPGCLIEIFEKDLITFDGFGTPTMSNRNLVYDLDILHELFPENKYNGNFPEYIWDTSVLTAYAYIGKNIRIIPNL